MPDGGEGVESIHELARNAQVVDAVNRGRKIRGVLDADAPAIKEEILQVLQSLTRPDTSWQFTTEVACIFCCIDLLKTPEGKKQLRVLKTFQEFPVKQ